MINVAQTNLATAHRLRSLSIIGGFLDGQRFDFADGLNCITGPKGTGKTTIIEFIRFALDALPDSGIDQDTVKQIESLVAGNLGTGRVELAIETKEGVPYTIHRTWGEEPLVLTADGEPTAISPRAGLFNADIFGVNQIETIAETPSAQLALLDAFEIDRMSAINERIVILSDKLKANAGVIVPMEEQRAKLGGELEGLDDLNDRIKSLAATQVGDLHELDAGHTEKALLDRQQRSLSEALEFAKKVGRDLQDFATNLSDAARHQFDKDLLRGLGSEVITKARQEMIEFAAELDLLIRQARQATVARQATLANLAKELGKINAKHELAFQKLQDKHDDAKEKSAERTKLERQRNVLLAKSRQRQQVVKELQQLHAQRIDMIGELSLLWDQRSQIRQAVVDRINQDLMPAIRVTLTQKADRQAYSALVEECLAGTNMRTGSVAEKLSARYAPAELVEVLRLRDAKRLVEEARLNTEQADKTIAALSDSPRLFDIQVAELGDFPMIELLDHDIYKNSLHVSSGQKCTAILPILMLDSSKPLLIDQPEENLDNAFIYETMVRTILNMKHRRQLVFVTHNPNIPVLGDAEGFFRMESSGDHTKITMHGSVEELRGQVMHLEGGPEAFEGRMKRYGY